MADAEEKNFADPSGVLRREAVGVKGTGQQVGRFTRTSEAGDAELRGLFEDNQGFRGLEDFRRSQGGYKILRRFFPPVNQTLNRLNRFLSLIFWRISQLNIKTWISNTIPSPTNLTNLSFVQISLYRSPVPRY